MPLSPSGSQIENPSSGGGAVTAVSGNIFVSSVPASGEVPIYVTGSSEFLYGYPLGTLINVATEYGVIADGATDQSTKIQNAMNAVTALRPGLYFPGAASAYICSVAITDPNTGALQTIAGDGGFSTVIKTAGTNNIFTLTHITDGTARNGFQLYGITFEGPQNALTTTSGTQNGVAMSNANHNSGGVDISQVTVKNCTFLGFSGYGLSLTNPILSSVDNCTFESNGQGVLNTGGTTTSFNNCYALLNVGVGYNIVNTQATSLVSCAADSNGIGYLFKGCNACTMVACDCESSIALNTTPTLAARTTTTATITVANNYAVGNFVVISGGTSTFAPLNGRWKIVTASSTQFTFTTTTSGSIASGNPTPMKASIFPGDGIQITVNSQNISIIGAQNYTPGSATAAAFFVDDTSFYVGIDGYYQNTAGGTNDIYLAPGSNNITIQNSIPIGAIAYFPGTNVYTNNVSLAGNSLIYAGNASATTGLTITCDSSGTPTGLLVQDNTNYANANPLIALNQKNASDTGANIQSTSSATANLHLKCVNGSAATVFSVNQAGVIANYNNVATISPGVPSIIGTINITGQVAAVTATTVYTPTVTGLYKLDLHLQWTVAPTSGVIGPVTITYTDGDNSVAQSVIMAMQSTTGTSVTSTTLFTTASQINGSICFYAETGVAIQYAIAQSGTIGSGTWAAHGRLTAL